MKELDSIYFAARELPAEKRPAYLAKICAGDQGLRTRVEQMLAVADQAEAFITDLPDDESANRNPGREPIKTLKLEPDDRAEEIIGQKIGRYKILERVGEGGCGVVYVAEQTEPVRRRVALKVIKLGMDTKQVVARFEAERQALAMMEHPNIAKVLDAGTTDLGRPYFVMELVRGIRITDYCDQANLSTKERLDLFIKVCRAIQHAHQKGIIHRDIKPSNILVTLHDGVPVPKVIDFGIAKATEGRLTDATVYTQLHQFIGTPAYMSPEQAEMSGLDIDTRSDIYSLGVAGSTPFDAEELMSLGIDAMRKTIREQEPPRPSTRLATLGADQLTTTSKRRSADKSKLLHQLQGDLDWIVMKCLEKDRARRYETANGLAADLTRHLSHEPVDARPPSTTYRLQKVWRRNRLMFTATAAVALVLMVGFVVSAWQMVRANRQAQRAVAAETVARQRLTESEASMARAVDAEQKATANAASERTAREESEAVSKLMTGVLQSPDPARDGRTITVAEMLTTAVKNLDKELAGQPARKAALQNTIAGTYRRLGLMRESLPLFHQVRDYHRAHSGAENAQTLQAMADVASTTVATDKLDEGIRLMEELVTIRRRVNGPNDSATIGAMSSLALAYRAGKRDTEMLQLAEDLGTLVKPDLADARTVRAKQIQTEIYLAVGRVAEAIEIQEEVTTQHSKTLAPENPARLSSTLMLSRCYMTAHRWLDAARLLKNLLPIYRQVYGPEHAETMTITRHLAHSRHNAGQLAEAIELYESVVQVQKKIYGPENSVPLGTMDALAQVYVSALRWNDAISLREEVVRQSRRVLGTEHSFTFYMIDRLASIYQSAGRRPDAIQLQEEFLSLIRKSKSSAHPETIKAMRKLATSYESAGRNDEALKLREEAVRAETKTDSP